MKKISLNLLVCLAIALLAGCQKFLDQKPDTKLAVPTTLTDFQALLDNYNVINNNDTEAGEISADNYYLTDADYTGISTDDYKRTYIWQKDHLFSELGNDDWFYTYRPVFTANTVLDGISNINPNAANQTTYNNVKGQAFYIRGYAFFQAASLWADAYDEATSSSQLGVPLRLGINFNENSVRSTLKESYEQIIGDVKSAIGLLPVTSVHVMRPSKPAAYALLAKVYLSMRKYESAGLYADSCLQLNHTLLDYNKLSTTATYPFAQFNAEVIHENKTPTPLPLTNTRARIDSQLYASYAANDLRKTLFFKSSTNGSFVFKGSYEGGANLFSGIATDEVYLIRAECFARRGNNSAAFNDLNTLLTSRYKTGTFVSLNSSNTSDALNTILTERRKELLMRGSRWTDLKRLNKDGANIGLTRLINGVTYTLPPNDLRYALPIPEEIISLTGMQQNPR